MLKTNSEKLQLQISVKPRSLRRLVLDLLKLLLRLVSIVSDRGHIPTRQHYVN